MNSSLGHFSLIQYCPDLSRREAVNLGVLLFCPERDFLGTRLSGDNDRVRRFFGDNGRDWKRFDSHKQGMADRLQSERAYIRDIKDLEHFINNCGNNVIITQPLRINVTDPERDLDRLFADLVADRPRDRQQVAVKRILARRVRVAGLGSQVRRAVEVTVPILATEARFPFGFQNGRFNLIRPVGFRMSTVARARREACLHAVEGRSLYENPDPQLGPLQLLVVGRFGPNFAEVRPAVARIFEQHHVRLVAASELDRLVDEIGRTAAVLTGSG